MCDCRWAVTIIERVENPRTQVEVAWREGREREREREEGSFLLGDRKGRPRVQPWNFSSSDSARTWPFSDIGLFQFLCFFVSLLQRVICTILLHYSIEFNCLLSWSPHLIISHDQARGTEYVISAFENSLGNIGVPRVRLSGELLFLVSPSGFSPRSFLLGIGDWMITHLLGVSMAYYPVLADWLHTS